MRLIGLFDPCSLWHFISSQMTKPVQGLHKTTKLAILALVNDFVFPSFCHFLLYFAPYDVGKYDITCSLAEYHFSNKMLPLVKIELGPLPLYSDQCSPF